MMEYIQTACKKIICQLKSQAHEAWQLALMNNKKSFKKWFYFPYFWFLMCVIKTYKENIPKPYPQVTMKRLVICADVHLSCCHRMTWAGVEGERQQLWEPLATPHSLPTTRPHHPGPLAATPTPKSRASHTQAWEVGFDGVI